MECPWRREHSPFWRERAVYLTLPYIREPQRITRESLLPVRCSSYVTLRSFNGFNVLFHFTHGKSPDRYQQGAGIPTGWLSQSWFIQRTEGDAVGSRRHGDANPAPTVFREHQVSFVGVRSGEEKAPPGIARKTGARREEAHHDHFPVFRRGNPDFRFFLAAHPEKCLISHFLQSEGIDDFR